MKRLMRHSLVGMLVAINLAALFLVPGIPLLNFLAILLAVTYIALVELHIDQTVAAFVVNNWVAYTFSSLLFYISWGSYLLVAVTLAVTLGVFYRVFLEALSESDPEDPSRAAIVEKKAA